MGNTRNSKHSKLKLLNSDIRNSIRTISEKDLKKKYNIPIYELEELEIVKNRLFKLLIYKSTDTKEYHSLFGELMNCKSADDYMEVYKRENSDVDENEYLKSARFVFYDLYNPRGNEMETNYFLTIENNIEAFLCHDQTTVNPYRFIKERPELKQIILSGYYFLWINGYCYTAAQMEDVYLNVITDKDSMSEYDIKPAKLGDVKKHLKNVCKLQDDLRNYETITPDLSFFDTKKGKQYAWVKEWYEAVCELVDKIDMFIKMGIAASHYEETFSLFSNMIISTDPCFEEEYMSIGIEFMYQNNVSFPDFSVFAALEDDRTYTNAALLCFGNIETLIHYISALVKMNIHEIRRFRPCLELNGLQK